MLWPWVSEESSYSPLPGSLAQPRLPISACKANNSPTNLSFPIKPYLIYYILYYILLVSFAIALKKQRNILCFILTHYPASKLRYSPYSGIYTSRTLCRIAQA